MPHFLVVRCFQAACQTFQVTQEKKAGRWRCAVCGELQSVRYIYAKSSRAADCRVLAQGYNMQRRDAASPTSSSTGPDTFLSTVTPTTSPVSAVGVSRWAKYIEGSDSEGHSDSGGGEEEDPRFVYTTESLIEATTTTTTSAAKRGPPLPTSSSSPTINAQPIPKKTRRI